MRVAAAVCIVVGGLLFGAGARAQEARLGELGWLAGCWQADGGEPGSGEHWLAPAGGTLLGVSRTVRQGRTVAHEFMQIRAAADGGLVLVALPSGQRETSFPLKHLADGEVVFENLQHDFPQRVIYRRVSADRLMARIEGQHGERLRGRDFPFQRTDCRQP